MYQYFIWNGIKSTDMGVIMLKAPSISIPQRRVNEIKVSGRNGTLHEDEQTFGNYTKEAECHVMDRSQIDEVCKWLTGFGEVIFSSEPDKVYRAYIKNQISFGSILKNINDFLIQFDVQPFKYRANPLRDDLELTAPTIIRNSGTVYSEPIITVYGSGDITLSINDVDYPLYGVSEYITIDSEMMEVFKENMNQNSKYGGETFPRFEVGENTISWTGNVTKVEIQPKWRWL